MPSDGTNPQIENGLPWPIPHTAQAVIRFLPKRTPGNTIKTYLSLSQPTNSHWQVWSSFLCATGKWLQNSSIEMNSGKRKVSHSVVSLSPGNRQLVILLKQIKEKEKKYITALERERVLSQDAKDSRRLLIVC